MQDASFDVHVVHCIELEKSMQINYLWNFLCRYPKPLWTVLHIRLCHHTRGTDFLCPPFFMPGKPCICGLPRYFLVDAAGHISSVFNLRTRISLFFLCCLVDVSISWTQYSCGFQRSGWTLPVAEHRGVELVKRSSNTCLRLIAVI